MKYNILASGSSGNGTVINDHILIDCGLSFKALKPFVKGLDLVLLTHIHSDHFKPSTIQELHRRRPGLRFGCCRWMVEPLLYIGISNRIIDVMEPGWDYVYGDGAYTIRTFSLVHNVPNCGYLITENEETLFYATDTGSLANVQAPNCDIYLIEANHSEKEIQQRIREKIAAGEYSYEAAAATNHLSREKAFEWLSHNMGPSSRYVFMHQHVNREVVHDGSGQNAQIIHPHIEDG